MSMQAADQDVKHHSKRANITVTAKKPSFFKMRAQMRDQDAPDRLNIRGEPMPGDSKENKRVPVVYRDGEVFE